MAAVDTALARALQLSIVGRGGAHETALPVETVMAPEVLPFLDWQ